MKLLKTLTILALCYNLLNGYEGKELKLTKEDKEYTKQVHQDLYKYVILNNVKKTISDIKKLDNSIKDKKSVNVKEYFADFVSSWKSVETFYFLGELDEDYLDTPRYIDIFHQGNENIYQQLDLILNSTDDIDLLLYKNSHKSINALEYLVSKKDIKNPRVNKALNLICKALEKHLENIYSGYKKYEQSFYEDDKKSNGIIINSLIESSYKLKEWRVADIAGLSRKYKNNPDISRAEYNLSKNSKLAIKSILQTYKKVLNSPNFKDFGDYFETVIKTKKINEARAIIDESLKKLENLKDNDLTKSKDLYKSLKKLHTTFYIHLIESLKMSAKILDADGD